MYFCSYQYILNQIPNATSNTFLNNSQPTERRPIPFKPWLDKCVRHSTSSLNDLRDFMRSHSLFVLWYPLTKKSQKRRQKITFFNVVLLCVNVFFFFFFFFFFVICRHFTTLKWFKVLKLSKICLKWSKP